MPKLHDIVDAFLGDLEGHINTAYPSIAGGSNKIYRGWPNLELTWEDVPCAMMVVQEFPISAERAAQIDIPVMIVVLLPLPADKTKNIMMEGLKEADKLIELLESQAVWSGGGVNSYVTSVDAGPSPLEGSECHRIVIDFKVEYHKTQGT